MNIYNEDTSNLVNEIISISPLLNFKLKTEKNDRILLDYRVRRFEFIIKKYTFRLISFFKIHIPVLPTGLTNLQNKKEEGTIANSQKNLITPGKRFHLWIYFKTN